MRTLFVLAPLALFPSAAPGNTAASQEAAVPQENPEQKLAALIARFEKQQNEINAAYEKATNQEQRDKIWAGRPGKEYVPEFRAIAEAAAGTETAAKAWLWTLKLMGNDPKEAQRIVDLLLDGHIQSESMGELTGFMQDRVRFFGAQPTADALRRIVADSPHERVRAGALLALGQVMLGRPSSEEKAEGRDCLEAVMAEYGELPYGSSTYAKAAEGWLYELEHLQIGMAAPDFEAIDENGVPWKLSDYRGKVVVVDFWGFW